MEAGPGGTGPTAAVAAPETWQDRFVDSTGVVSQVLGERALSLIAHYTHDDSPARSISFTLHASLPVPKSESRLEGKGGAILDRPTSLPANAVSGSTFREESSV
jgi:hypothetical protein